MQPFDETLNLGMYKPRKSGQQYDSNMVFEHVLAFLEIDSSQNGGLTLTETFRSSTDPLLSQSNDVSPLVSVVDLSSHFSDYDVDLTSCLTTKNTLEFQFNRCNFKQPATRIVDIKELKQDKDFIIRLNRSGVNGL